MSAKRSLGMQTEMEQPVYRPRQSGRIAQQRSLGMQGELEQPVYRPRAAAPVSKPKPSKSELAKRLLAAKKSKPIQERPQPPQLAAVKGKKRKPQKRKALLMTAVGRMAVNYLDYLHAQRRALNVETFQFRRSAANAVARVLELFLLRIAKQVNELGVKSKKFSANDETVALAVNMVFPEFFKNLHAAGVNTIKKWEAEKSQDGSERHYMEEFLPKPTSNMFYPAVPGGSISTLFRRYLSSNVVRMTKKASLYLTGVVSTLMMSIGEIIFNRRVMRGKAEQTEKERQEGAPLRLVAGLQDAMLYNDRTVPMATAFAHTITSGSLIQPSLRQDKVFSQQYIPQMTPKQRAAAKAQKAKAIEKRKQDMLKAAKQKKLEEQKASMAAQRAAQRAEATARRATQPPVQRIPKKSDRVTRSASSVALLAPPGL